MLISLNWLRDFVDLPNDLSVTELADRFTTTCAEVENVEPIRVDAQGLICAQVQSVRSVKDDSVRLAVLDCGRGKTVETVTSAVNLKPGDRVIYAPSGASVRSLGEIVDTTIAGNRSSGMILPGDALGIALAAREPIFCPPSLDPGTMLDVSMFEDWVIEIDNHSINHRPDLWGHYGIAREFAAVYGVKLRPYPVVAVAELTDSSLPEIPIHIDDAKDCPRYTGLLMDRVESRPAPLWMQLRLGHVGLRPIDCLVDLTNYIMLELGQPMHAFDGDGVDRIEVGTVEAGTKFTTLDEVERTLPEQALMILTNRRPIAIAGIMGGLETEISADTKSMLLESANFNPYIIRRTTNALGHRTDASARFEKSLDPAHTVLAVQRFVHLARAEYENLTLTSRLSDAHPNPPVPLTITVDPNHVREFMGHDVSRERMIDILTALEFQVADNGDRLTVGVPSFRATRDIEIDVDIIEEIARFVGYDNIAPQFPRVQVRALETNPLQQLERRTLRVFVDGLNMVETHRYLWEDCDWCAKLGYDPGGGLTLRNPPAAGLENMRATLIPGLLQVADLNRHHFAEMKLIELGSAFPAGNGDHVERRRVGILCGIRQKAADDRLLATLKGDIETWAWQTLSHAAAFDAATPVAAHPWQHPDKTAVIHIGDRAIGRTGVVPFDQRRRIDEHLSAWSFAWAEFDLDDLVGMLDNFAPLSAVPPFPEVELDFSVLTDASRRFSEIRPELATFNDALLRRITFVDSYEGKSVPKGKRSMTFRAKIGMSDRTLVEDDVARFRAAFEQHLAKRGLQLRTL